MTDECPDCVEATRKRYGGIETGPVTPVPTVGAMYTHILDSHGFWHLHRAVGVDSGEDQR